MTRLGIITNPTSGRNRPMLERVRAWTTASGALAREVADLESIRTAAAVMREAQVDVLAVNGGDGTAQAVLTELWKTPGPRPQLALLPGGTTNMSAYDLNRCRDLDDALARLSEQSARPPAERRRVSRALVRVDVAGEPVQYGLFLAAGVILRGMRHFREFVGARGLRGELAGGISVLRGLAGVARGSGGWADTPGSTVTLAGGAGIWPDQILVVATTLRRLLLGFTPWWGDDDGPLRVTGLSRRPRSLLRLTPALLRGRAHARLTPANGYRSAAVSGLDLTGGGGFALDGEVFPLAHESAASVSVTEPVEFLSL
jgi:hypothetical protein